MSDADLRKKLIRLAHENEDLRPHVLPLLKEAAKVFRGKGDWALAVDKVLYVGEARNLSNGHVVDLLGTVSFSPSAGTAISFAAQVTLRLDADLPVNAKNAKVWSFDLKVKPPAFKGMVNNVLVASQDKWATSALQHIRRAV